MSSFVEFFKECFGIRLSGTPTSFNYITMTSRSRHFVAVEHVTMRPGIILTELMVAQLRNIFCVCSFIIMFTTIGRWVLHTPLATCYLLIGLHFNIILSFLSRFSIFVLFLCFIRRQYLFSSKQCVWTERIRIIPSVLNGFLSELNSLSQLDDSLFNDMVNSCRTSEGFAI